MRSKFSEVYKRLLRQLVLMGRASGWVSSATLAHMFHVQLPVVPFPFWLQIKIVKKGIWVADRSSHCEITASTFSQCLPWWHFVYLFILKSQLHRGTEGESGVFHLLVPRWLPQGMPGAYSGVAVAQCLRYLPLLSARWSRRKLSWKWSSWDMKQWSQTVASTFQPWKFLKIWFSP